MPFRKIKAGLVNSDIEQFVGEEGNLFFDIETGILRLSNGIDPGGTIVSGGSGGSGNYTLPTASTTTKGGIKVDGTTLNVSNEIISVGTVPYSSISGKPTAVSAFTNDSGYLTSSSLSSYATQSYVTGRGYITSADLPTAVSELTNDSGYLTDAEFDLNTIDYDSNNNLHATGILPGDTDGFTAIFAGRAAGIAALPNTVIQSQAQVNDYAQNNFQNTNDGTHASTEWVATSPNGDDSNYYIDMGINGASWDGTASNSLYDNVGQRDGWVYVQGGNAGGGNLILGTSIANTYTKIIAGDVSTGDREVARFSATEVKLKKQLTFNDNTTQTTAWTGSVSYNDLTDTPTLVTSYNDLTDLPTLVTSYNQLTNLPSLFSGAYADLTGKPTLFSGSYNDLTNKPVTVQSLSDLSDVDLTTPPTIGQVLKYDGTKWSPGTDITSGGAGTDADTLDGFDSSYFLNYNNFTNKPTIPTTVTVNGTALTLGSSGTITANTTNALTIGYGLTGTASTFNGSAANTVALDTSTTAVTATSGGTLTLSASTLTRNYVVSGGATGGTYTIKLPDLTTLNVGQQITFFTTASLIAWQLSTGTSIVTNANFGSVARATTFTVISNAANSTGNIAFTALPYTGSTVGIGTALVTNNSPFITAVGTDSINNSNSTLSVGTTSTVTQIGTSGSTFSHTVNISSGATAAAYVKNINIGTNLNGGTSTINIGTGVSSGTATMNIGSSTTTTVMNGAVTITSLTATNSIVGSITGNAATATKLGTARAINGVNFDGSAAITITAANPNALTIGSGLSGTSYDGSTTVTIAVDNTVALRADTAYVGTTAITLNRSSASQTLTGVSIDGNAATVTDGVYTTGTYANPSWITSLAYSKLTGTPTIFSGSYTDLTNKPTIPTNVSELANDRGYITAAAIPAQFTFNVAADDSTQVAIGTEETIKFIGAGGISTASDAEGNITITQSAAAAGTLTGSTLASGVTASSLTSVGTLNGLTVSKSTSGIALSISAEPYTPVGTQTWTFRTATGLGIPYSSWINFPDGTNQTTAYTGNADTVTNGVYTTGSYADPSWITSLAGSKITNAVLTTDTGTVTNTMLSGSIANNKLVNSSVTVNGSAISLGGSATITAANPNALTIGTGLSGTSYTGSAAVTIAIDSTVATLTGSQTLTNKTLTLPTIGGTGATFNGSTSGTTVLKASATAGTTTITMPATTGTLITTGDTGTVTNAMLAGSIANSKLANSAVTVNGTSISLGSSATISVNSISASGFSSSLGFDAGGSLILSNTTTFRSPNGLTIQTGGPSFKNWTFDTSGSITFPDSTVQTTAWTGVADYNNLTNKPAIPQTFTFNVAADDSTTRTIDREETISFIGAGGITTASNAEGAITITGGSTTIGTTAISLGSSSTTLAGLTSVDGAASSFNLLASPTSVTAFSSASTINLGYTSNTGSSNTFNISTVAQAFGTTKTVNIGTGSSANSATAINIGSTSGSSTVTINGVLEGSRSSQDLFNYAATTINFAGAATTLNIGSSSGSSKVVFNNSITIPGSATTLNNSATNNNISIGTSGQLFDDGNFHIHATAGTLWLNSLDSGDISIGTQYNSGTGSNVNIGKNLVANSGSITANATTAFIAGANAVSGVALQMPSEAALRNLTNGATNMYFDVSIGGSTQGSFQFRSSSSYTNVLTMSSTGVTFNTDATFTSRTPSVSRTAFNSAIDTEITVDNMRFRISNQGGIFPQVIGNGSSRNLAWTGVGACSGAAIAQVGSTGTIVSTSAWTTLYNSHGMDAAGDTVTVTLQDKAAGRIYRITFMRSDNGSTTGYNIIGERIL